MIDILKLNESVLNLKSKNNKNDILRIYISEKTLRPDNTHYEKLIYVCEFNKLSESLLNKTGKFSKWYLNLVKSELETGTSFRVEEYKYERDNGH